jgi:large subunit ribosomal protein L25
MVEQQLFTLAVRALPTDIPNAVELDVSGLTIGSSLRVADLSLPEGVAAETDPEVTVVVGQPPRVEAAAAGPEGVPEGAAAESAVAEQSGAQAETPGDEA